MPKNNIKELRTAKNMTQLELAKAVNSTAPTMGRIEVDIDYARLGLLKKIAEVLGVDLKDLID